VAALEGERPLAGDRQGDEAGDQRQEQGADRPRARHRQVQQLRHGDRLEQERRAGEADEPQPEGDVAEQHHAGDVDRRHPPPRVEAGAQRRAGEQRHAEGVAEGVAGERGEGDLPVGDPLADVAQGERVVAGEGEVAQDGEGDRHDHPVRRQVVEEVDDVAVAEVAQLAAEQPEGQPEEEEAEQRGELGELDFLHRSGFTGRRFRTSPSV
jgi:hypothetical protein